MGYQLKKPLLASELVQQLGLFFSGEDRQIEVVCGFQDANPCDLIFSPTLAEAKRDCIPITFAEESGYGRPVSHSDTPRQGEIMAPDYLEKLRGFEQPNFKSEIHATVKLGKNDVIEDGCVIEEGVEIGHNAVIHSGSRIGKRSIIRSGAVIGGNGFAFSRNPDGTPVRFVHLGGEWIGQHVEVGDNTCICRGALGDTVIEDGVKLDSLVFIAHNCHNLESAYVIACAEISGSVRIGRNAWIGPNTCVKEQITIGEEALVGIGSVVIRNLDAHTVIAGSPTKVLRKLR